MIAHEARVAKGVGAPGCSTRRTSDLDRFLPLESVFCFSGGAVSLLVLHLRGWGGVLYVNDQAYGER